MNIRLETARREDYPALVLASKRAFENDVNYGAPRPGGPVGYDAVWWFDRVAALGRLFKIIADDRTLIGGAVVQDHGRDHYELGRIFIDPAYQDKGVGTQAMGLIEAQFPGWRLWTLETPAWNARCRHFYEKLGYVRAAQVGEQVYYEKHTPKPGGG